MHEDGTLYSVSVLGSAAKRLTFSIQGSAGGLRSAARSVFRVRT